MTQTLFLRPRFNIVVVRGGMQVEVRAQDRADPATNLLTSLMTSRESAHA
ncbi:MAG: hypothetical protein WBV82_20330 [Myxococcaceae bacterium]